jgi:hypothetical protein
MSGAERAKYYKEQKKLRRRKQKLDCYNCNSEKYNQAKKTNRQINGNNTERSKAAVYKQKQRSDLKLNRESTNNCIVTEKDKKLMVNIML